MRHSRVILNGKGAASPPVRNAIERLRAQGQPLEVRVTWEGGDAARYAREALQDGVEVLVAGGGDGTLNEVVNGILKENEKPALALGILPLGTANDFARGTGIPLDPYEALVLATSADPVMIDVPAANGIYFINVASGGFGAEVTVSTPGALKKAAGGGAYALVGIVTAAKMKPYTGRMVGPDTDDEGSFIVMAVGNARQAGGGMQVTPRAVLNDGLLDVLFIRDFTTLELGQVIQELQDPTCSENRFVHYQQIPNFTIETAEELPINLDGEPQRWDRIRFDILPRCLPVVLPADCPLLKS